MSRAYVTGDPGPTLQRAWQLYRWRRYALAREEAQKFLARYPENAEALALVALCHAREKRYSAAKLAAGEAVRHSPDWSYSYYVLGLIHIWVKEYGPAKQALAEALRLNPIDSDLYELLAGLHAEQGHLETSLWAADAGLKHDAEHVGCQYRRAVALLSLNQCRAAEQAFRTVMRLDAQHAQAQGFLGQFAVQRGDLSEALPLLRNALREHPEWEVARSAWQEALRGKSRFYRTLVKLKVVLFEKWILLFLAVVYALSFGVLIFVLEPDAPVGNRFGPVTVISVIVTIIVLAMLFAILQGLLGLMSRWQLLRDPELRRSLSWKEHVLSNPWAYILVIYALLLLLYAIFRA